MIANERVQNAIVVSVIIVAVVSSTFLVNNTSYYGGSYSLAARMTVSLLDVQVSNIDHTNDSINPSVRLTFNLATSSQAEGNVRLTFMGAAVTLNDDLLSYLIFSYVPPIEEQYLFPEFNETYEMQSAATAADIQAILDADTSDIWSWTIEFRYSFIVFDEPGTITFRFIDFNTTITTIV
ncbi:hypothetical protein E4H12_02745 [Candidatus Thorarchaeota archaeon]|nr:hypothetical protein [Candidatus Thorarchaeota archaeon]TFG99427.1 MAG: hypothetical protein E4H12_02745 [Candidatus Thorarchaeota archaeon]